MGILQEDSELILQNISRTPLPEEAVVSKRDQVVSTLLKQAQERDLGIKVCNMWHKYNADRLERTERMEILSKWDEYIDDLEQKYDGTSNLHIPMPLIVLRTFHARMFQALFAVTPPFTAKAMQDAYQEKLGMIQGLMGWTLTDWCNYHEGVEAQAERWIWNWAGFGSGVLKGRWDRRFTRYIDVEESVRQGPSKYRVAINPETGFIEEVVSPSSIKVEEEVEKVETIFDGPVIEFLPEGDVAIIGGDDVQTCDAVIHRQWLNASMLWTLADTKQWSKEAVEKLLSGAPDTESGAEGNESKQEREGHAGEQVLDTDTDLDKYEILEAHIDVDVNQDGLNESIVLFVSTKTKEILGATYRHRICKNGKRPFVKADFIPREGHGYSMGLLEILHPLSTELDFIHNLKIDMGLATAMPIGFFRAASGLESKIMHFKPGDWVPMDNPSQDVFVPQFSSNTNFFATEETNLLGMIERLTSINDINTATLGRQGVGRTATGVSALLNENNANLDIFIRRLQRAWKQMLRILFAMLQQRMPDGLEFRVTGEDGRDYFKTINRNDIQMKVDFTIEANSADSNKLIQQEKTEKVLAQMMNPLFIQMGIVKSSSIYEALKDYFLALDKRDFSRFLFKPTEGLRILTPQEELRRLAAGQEVPVELEMDHKGFMTLWDSIKESETVNQIKPEFLDAIDRQYTQHESMLASLEAQAAQIQQSMQQTTNSMGAGGGSMPGGAPMLPNMGMNPYNDFQVARGNFNRNIARGGGGMVPGMSSPTLGRKEI